MCARLLALLIPPLVINIAPCVPYFFVKDLSLPSSPRRVSASLSQKHPNHHHRQKRDCCTTWFVIDFLIHGIIRVSRRTNGVLVCVAGEASSF